MKKRVLSITALSLILLGCNTTTNHLPFDLSDKALFAISASEELSTSPLHEKGYLLFIGKEGIIGKMPHKGMRLSHVGWDKSGIVYMDEKTDYWIGNNGTINEVQVNRAEMQEGLIKLDEQQYAGLFNEGITPDGYSEQLFISTPNGHKSSIVDGKNIINKYIYIIYQNATTRSLVFLENLLTPMKDH